MINRLICILTLLLFIQYSFAQSFPYEHYSMDDGLASNKTFDLAIDSTGYIWISTENGLNKFDGNKFKLFNQSDGLKTSDIVEICFDKKGNLWVEGFKAGLQIIRNDSIITPHISQSEISQYKHLTYFNNNIYFIDASTNFAPYYINNGVIHQITSIPRTGFLYVTDDNKLLAGCIDGIYIINNYTPTKINIAGLNKRNIHSIVKSGNITWVGSDNEILKIVDNKVTTSYSTIHNVNKLVLDYDGGLWYGMSEGGAGYLLEGENNIHVQLLDSTILVSDILMDKQNSIWITTYGDGVYRFNNKFILDYSHIMPTSNTPVLCIIDYKDSGILLGFQDQLITLDKDNNFNKISLPRLFPTKLLYQDNTIWVAGQSVLLPTFQKIKNNILFVYGTAAYFESDSIVYTTINGLLNKNTITNTSMKLVSRFPFDEKRNKKVYSIEKVKDTLWLATTGSLYAIYNNTFIAFDSFTDIKQIIKDKDNHLWLASNNGLLKLNSNHTVESAFFKDNSIKCIYLGDDEIWVGTNNGLMGLKNNKTIRITSRQGLPNNNINCIYNRGKYLWVGTDKGFCRVDMDAVWEYNAQPPVKLYFTSVETLKDTIFSPDTILSYTSNTDYLKFNFSSINFASNNLVEYQYRFDDQNWISTTSLSISISLLRHGEHSIQLRARNFNSNWVYSKKLDFIIAPPFQNTPLFSFLIISLVLGSVILVYQLKQKKQKKELAVAREITSLRHRSLHAMMNPHFIFNSLSSIQYFVTTKQQKSANVYISKLADLIRLNLAHSIENDVTLEEEIRFIKLYLELEKIRFEEKFDYDIILNNLADHMSIMIPTLLIQPLVENAIIHGILPSENKGHIAITFSYSGRILKISVKDNGVGYIPNTKNTNHDSLALDILAARINLRNEGHSKLNSFTISEVEESGNVKGTEAIITLKV